MKWKLYLFMIKWMSTNMKKKSRIYDFYGHLEYMEIIYKFNIQMFFIKLMSFLCLPFFFVVTSFFALISLFFIRDAYMLCLFVYVSFKALNWDWLFIWYWLVLFLLLTGTLDPTTCLRPNLLSRLELDLIEKPPHPLGKASREPQPRKRLLTPSNIRD